MKKDTPKALDAVSERDLFEATFGSSRVLMRATDDSYVSMYVQNDWEVWQAARATPSTSTQQAAKSAAASDLNEANFSVDAAMEAIQLIVGEDTDVLLSDEGAGRVYSVLEKISPPPARIDSVQFPPIKGAWIDGGYVIVTPAGSGPDKAPAVMAAILAAAKSVVVPDRAIGAALNALEILNRRPRPMCRDCADENGTCPGSGLPCDMSAVIRNARAAAKSAAPAAVEAAYQEHIHKTMPPMDDAGRSWWHFSAGFAAATQAPAAVDQMRAHVESFASSLGWKAESGEGAFEFVQRASYRQGWQDGRREALGDAHRDLPEVLKDLDHICAHGDPGSQETAHDARDKLRALSAPMPAGAAVGGWQPIETAPKDGLVDILLPSGRRYADCHYDKICSEYRHITACGVLVRLGKASHWMRPPAPPLGGASTPTGGAGS